MWTILKSLLNFLEYFSSFMIWFFGHKTCGMSAPLSGVKPTLPELEGEILTTVPPWKLLDNYF